MGAALLPQCDSNHSDHVEEVSAPEKDNLQKIEEEGEIIFQQQTPESLGYNFTEEIAQVNHGVIQLATHQADSTFRVVKCYFKADMQPDTSELMKSEVELMFALGKHPKIGEAIEIFQDAHSYFLSMPYYDGGTLVGLKRRAVDAGVVLVEDWWKNVFCQCLEGLAYMHVQDVMHCDIKEPNIMLRSSDLDEPDVVLIDLGVAQRATTKRTIIYGTPGYIPPEVWEGKNWYPESDMFSLGVVVVQTLIGKTGIFTQNTRTYKEVFEATRKRPPPFELMPVEFPALQGLAQKLLEKDFQARPSASSMLEHPWKTQESTRGEDIDDRKRLSLKPFRRHNTCHATLVSLPPDDSTMEEGTSVAICWDAPDAPDAKMLGSPPTIAQDAPHDCFRATHVAVQDDLPTPVLRTTAVLPKKRRPKTSRRQLSFAV